MAITVFEDWAAYADNTELQNITGWTTSGVFPATEAGLKVNATSQLKSDSAGCLGFYESGSTSHYASVVLTTSQPSSVIRNNVAVRCSDYQHFISAKGFGGDIILFYRDGSDTDIDLGATITTSTFTAGDTVKLVVDGDTLELYINAVLIASRDITGVLSGSLAGLYSRNTGDPAFGDVEIGTVAGGGEGTITIDTDPVGTVVEASSGSTSHTISGAYTAATTPASIEYRIRDNATLATVQDWTVLDAAPANDLFTGAVTIAKMNYALIDVRFSNAITVTSTSNKIGFGITIEAGGQSNTVGMFGSALTATTPNVNTVIFDGVSTWNAPTTQAVVEYLNSLAVAHGCCVAVVLTAISSSTISEHLSGGSNYNNRVSALTSMGGELSGFYWGQGEANVSTNATYEADLVLLYQDILTRTGATFSELPIFIVQLGRLDGSVGTGDEWSLLRAAQTAFCNNNAGAFLSHQTMDLPMADSLHRDASGYVQESLRFADTFNAVLLGSGDTGNGVIPLSISISGADIVINHDFNGNTLISLPANAKDIYEASVDGFTTTLTINTISVTASNITLTTSSNITQTVNVRSLYSEDPAVEKMPVGDITYNGQAVMVEPITIPFSASAVSSTINLVASGLPDGSYSSQIWDDSVDPMVRLAVDNITFANGLASYDLTGIAPVGTEIYTRIDTLTPFITGVTCLGVSE